MITPEQIEAMAASITSMYEDVELGLVQSIAKHFDALEEVSDYDNWRIKKLQELGGLRKENAAIISKLTGRSEKEVADLLERAAKQSLSFDERIYEQAKAEGLLPRTPLPISASPAIRQTLAAAVRNTRSYLNAVNTTALQAANQGFLDIVNRVYLDTSLGVTDYNTSVRRAVIKLADKGITGADYVSQKGRRTSAPMDVAVRRCVVTSVTQSAGTMQEERAKDWGVNLVEVTSHIGARPDHAIWQGKVYSLEGSTAKYPNLRVVTGYGEVDGLMGANCRHTFFPFIEGISERTFKPYDKDENEKAYKESQEQRQLEREVRALKRKTLAADAIDDKDALKASQLALKDKEAEVRKFVDKTGRTQRENRQQVYPFGRSAAQRAVWTKRKEPVQIKM